MAFRRLKNLNDFLVRTRSNEMEREPDEVKRCKSGRCKCCSHLQEEKNFNIKEKNHEVKYGGTCKSENLIYAVKCSKCEL